MTQNTNLNISPYFDDFDENKNYSKVLFKPGFPVQARELTTLQTILQNQIEKFGQYFFKEGSIVIPGGTIYDSQYFAVRIDPQFLSLPVSAYTKILVDNNIKIKGETSGVTATVVNRVTSSDSIDDFDTLYVKYSGSGTDGETKEFQDGENLITLADINYSSTKIAANSLFASCINDGATKTGCSASVLDGIYFIRGYFVKVPKTTLILDQYTNTPSYKIGLAITEKILPASADNPDLYDNAKGFSNETAPGADRFALSVTLSKKLLTDVDDKSFIELIRVKEGVVEKFDPTTDPKFNYFEDALARRTYDESGDYYVRPFSIDIRESLNNRIDNRGLYFENQLTQNGSTPSDDVFCLQVSPGKAYVRGFEVQKDFTSAIDTVKPRTKKSKENISLPIKVGNIVSVNNVYGSPKIGFSSSTTYSVELRDERLTAASLPNAGHGVIGRARVYDWIEKDETVVGLTTTKYEVRLFDIQTFTNITVGLATAITAGDYVKGKYSGATGFATNTNADTTSWSLEDVRGQFQLNEPLLLNGIDVGRNVGVVTDYSFEDVKSMNSTVGVNTFAADLELNRIKKVFKENSQFNLTAGTGGVSGFSTVTSPSIVDWRSVVKVNDILRYNDGTDKKLPNYVQVASLGAGGTSITIDNVADIPGVTLSETPASAITVTEMDVVIPSLDKASNPGYIVPITNPYVSSVNILDSSYIIRKQLSKVTSAGGVVEFKLDDTGDDDLFFEPYTSDNYVLSWRGGERVLLRNEQVMVKDASRTFQVSGLRSAENYTLTATVKRTKLASKEKSITRCSVLDISKSKYSGSGITTTSFNDGLTFSAGGYGLRVQDEEISLNVSDIHRVLAVFESNDTNAPQVPTFTCDSASQSDVFNTNNVVVGEQIIGNNSGALARVVRVVSANQLEFVYENQKVFETSEVITLRTSGIIGTINNLVAGDRNIIDSYNLDQGHRQEFVDFGRLTRKKDSNEPTRKLKIIFDYYNTVETGSGTIETVNSYSSLNYTDEIPFVIDKKASDFLDLRPRVSPHSGNTSPFRFSSRDFSGSSTESVVSNESIVLDYNYYLGRIDRLYLTKDGMFELKQGEPSDNPKAPLPNDEGFEVGMVSMDPYVLNATYNVRVRMIPHKRYTMRDIGGLESRIKNLENYTTLSLLETDTKNLSVKDPNTGLDKFKSGFFVDNFRNHASHNLTGESKFDIDIEKGECRPRSAERNVSLVFETKSSKLNPLGTDYRFVTDFDSDDITRNGPGLTLAYTNTDFIVQPQATRVENLNPFAIAIYSGTIELTPASDFWIDEVVADTPEVISFGDSMFHAFADLLGVEDRENGGMSTGIFNTSEIAWGDREMVSEEAFNTDTESSTRTVRFGQQPGHPRWRNRTTTTTLTTQDFLQTWEQTGIEKQFGYNLSSTTETTSLGNKVTGTEVVFNCRSRNIEVVGRRLKPNTRYYVFMENIDVTEYCVPKLLPITMVRGAFSTSDIVQFGGPVAQVIGIVTPSFRVAQANHKFGAFNNPTEIYATEPYSNTTLTSSYSATSKVVNVDTYDLGNERDVTRRGYFKKGDPIINQAGTAEANVDALTLISDEFGNLIFSLHIPDPSNPSNPKFTTGLNTIRVTSSSTNAPILDPGESSAQTTYLASGSTQYSTEQTLSIRTPEIERQQIGGDQTVTRVTEELDVNRVTEDSVSISESGWIDPLAQSFIVPQDDFQDGIFLTGGDLFFKTKDTSDVTIQIRELDDGGRPSATILPFGQTKITPDSAAVSNDGSVGTGFTFSTPVYLKANGRYALTLITPELGWNAFITRMNEVDLLSDRLNDKQPSIGSLFKSQNSQLWSESNQEDLKFTLYKAKFVKNRPSSVLLYNNDLPLGKIRKENPIIGYSKRQNVSVAATTRSFTQGTKIEQTAADVTSTGNVFSSGGPIDSVISAGTALTHSRDTGIGLTAGTFTGVTFSSLNGTGSNAQGTVIVNAGLEVDRITITSGGSGYSQGDSLLSGPIGITGSAIRAIVGVVTTTDLVVVDNVNKNIASGIAITHYNSSGDANTVAITPTSVSNDSIRNGLTMFVDHRNHGMHASTNKVKIDNFVSDYAPVTLTEKIDPDTTTIQVDNATILQNFEGSPVGAANSGYLKIGKEIIGYETVNTQTNQLTDISRAIDGSLKSNHAANDYVNKYEFNSVSLRKINKTHSISSNAKTFDSYYITLSDNTKMFASTKAGGGKNVEISQNIPFESISPKISTITPTGTNVTARIKTTSGTSVSGTEASFNDKGYENVALNKINHLDSPRIVASKTNEYELLNEEKSFALELTLSTGNENVSPLVDLDTANIVVTSNLIDSNVSNYDTDSRPRIVGLDPNTAIYETKKIALEFPSNSLQVQFDGHREASSNIRVFYKLYRNDSQDFQQNYIPFNVGITTMTAGLSDKFVAPNVLPNGFSEYKFTAENVPQFSAFMIKVVMTSTNQAQPTRIKNFRAIALRSFDIT